MSDTINQAVQRLSGDRHGVGITASNGPIADAFGRIRTSHIEGSFDGITDYNTDTASWDEVTNGVGASITHLPNEASVQLTVGTVDGEYAINQTQEYFSYLPGKSQLIMMTSLFGEGKTNVIQRLGYYDDEDGLGFILNGVTLGVFVRTSTSGTVDDTNIINKSEWNIDRLDGSKGHKNPSELNIDITKAQIFLIDFQWLGVGRIRFGLVINGLIYYVHEVNNANSITSVYMKRPSLPLRYELRNNGVSASTTNLKKICQTLISEGGYAQPGYQFSANNGITAVTATGATIILAIRNRQLFNSLPNRKNSRLLKFNIVTDGSGLWELMIAHNTATVGGDWSDILTAESVVEYSVNPTITGGSQHSIDSGYVISAAGAAAGSDASRFGVRSKHSILHRNYANDNGNVLFLRYTPYTGSDDVRASMSWIEF